MKAAEIRHYFLLAAAQLQKISTCRVKISLGPIWQNIFKWRLPPGIAQGFIWVLVRKNKYLGTFETFFFRHWWDKVSTCELKTVPETVHWTLLSGRLIPVILSTEVCARGVCWEQAGHFHCCGTEMNSRLSARVQKVSSCAAVSEYAEDKFLSVTRYNPPSPHPPPRGGKKSNWF